MLPVDQSDLPPLPSYTLTVREPLLPPIPDNILVLILPIVAYWGFSLFFHWIDVNDYFAQYRLHTPAELLKRNHVSRWDVVRDVVLQQIIQTLFGLALAFVDEPELVGREEYDTMVWATRIRVAQRYIPAILSVLGLDPAGLAAKLPTDSMLAAAIRGGQYSFLTQEIDSGVIAPAFASWELALAGAIYWYAIPTLKFFYGIVFVDTWQYFLHRAMHMNKWLYSRSHPIYLDGVFSSLTTIDKFHSRHHRLYVPYAFGALYNHPVEGFLLDTAGTGLAFLTCSMTSRQGMVFFVVSTLKTIDDHCGYAFPFDPLQHVTSNNAPYHDIHHQSWGIKSNFSQPFFTFWDRLLDTQWTGGDVSVKYERSRNAAQKLVDLDNNPPTQGAAPSQLEEEDESESAATYGLLHRSVRNKTSSFSSQADNIKTVTHHLNGSIRQK